MPQVKGPVVTVPAPPEGWSRGDLVRLVDPTGQAMAWISPADGARCLALHRRDGEGWVVIDPGEGGVPLGGEWVLEARDPTSCRLVRDGKHLEVRVEAGSVIREQVGL